MLSPELYKSARRAGSTRANAQWQAALDSQTRPLTEAELAERKLRDLGQGKRWIIDQHGRIWIATELR